MDNLKVFVNSRIEFVVDDTYSYEEIVQLANKLGQPTVVYSGNTLLKESGSLVPGQSIHMRDGMQFTVMHTGNA